MEIIESNVVHSDRRLDQNKWAFAPGIENVPLWQPTSLEEANVLVDICMRIHALEDIRLLLKASNVLVDGHELL